MDVWQYILHEKIELPSLYFSHQRMVVNRDGVLLAKCEYISLKENEKWEEKTVRCRTIGDMTCTGVSESTSSSIEEIIEEVASTRITERGGRADDKRSGQQWRIEKKKDILKNMTKQKGYLDMELLRFTTAGSVDDGKSTLIGRLLFDSKAIFQDQLELLEETSKQRGEDDINLALLTDGLRSEREQGITIDVAYRYFATPKRKIYIADTPGHIQYTRNMVTGASTANLAILLIDVRHGVIEQTKSMHSLLHFFRYLMLPFV